MIEEETETLYRKNGRRYQPAFSSKYDMYDLDLMPGDSFRLTYAYTDGGRRYHYDVTPDSATFEAAAMLAAHAMTEAMQEASRYRYSSGSTVLSKRQQAAVAQARELLESVGLLSPMWTQSTLDEIVRVGIEAVRKAHQP